MPPNPKRKSRLFVLAIVAVALISTGLLTANAWLKIQRATRQASGATVKGWHKKMTDLACQMEGLDASQVIERFKGQGITANIGYEDVRINTCGQVRNCSKHVIATSAGQDKRIGPRVWVVQVFFDDSDHVFAAQVWTTESFENKDSIVEFCEPGKPSVRDRKGS